MCKLNPNYKETIKTRSEILKQASISSNQIKFSKKHGELKQFEVICKKCGKKFRQTSRNKKYCSLECYQIAKVTDSNKPSVLELLKDFKQLKSFVQVGKKYNVTDNAVRKWCKLYKIPTTSKEMKEYIKNM